MTRETRNASTMYLSCFTYDTSPFTTTSVRAISPLTSRQNTGYKVYGSGGVLPNPRPQYSYHP